MMDYKKELESVLKVEDFKNFWKCLKFLIDTGYNNFDSFAIAMLAFNETEMWYDVAFIRLEDYKTDNGELRVRVIVGLIDDNTRHLESTFNFYRKCLVDGIEVNIDIISEIEDKLTVIKFSGIDDMYLNLMGDISFRYYGYNIMTNEIKRVRKLKEVKEISINDRLRRNIK